MAHNVYLKKSQIEWNQVARKHVTETAAISCRNLDPEPCAEYLIFSSLIDLMSAHVDGCDFLQCLKIRHLAIGLTKGTKQEAQIAAQTVIKLQTKL